MFEQTFNNIDDILWKEGGCSNELDYVEQTSWILFLKYLDNLEAEREEEAELKGETYERIIDKKFRWNTWAAPKTKNGEPDHAKALTGDDLTDFVNDKLFPYLKKFKETATTPQSSSPATVKPIRRTHHVLGRELHFLQDCPRRNPLLQSL